MGRAVAVKTAAHALAAAAADVDGALRATPRARPLVALAGNPNTGKTTLFNRLTGSDHKVGNYPGVTVDRHSGTLVLPAVPGAERREIELVDVPGAYSLSSRSREEQIAFEAVAGLDGFERPELVVVVADATQLARNLYLVLQVLELGLPVVLAVNLCDELEAQGRKLDVPALERELGTPVAPLSALRGTGLDELRAAIARALLEPAAPKSARPWTPTRGALAEDVEAVRAALPAHWRAPHPARERALASWALLSLDEDDELDQVAPALRAQVGERRAAALAAGRDLDQELVRARWDWIEERAERFVTRPSPERSWSERADALLLHPLLGFAIFLVAMAFVFQALFAWADPMIGWIEDLFALLGRGLERLLPEGLLRDFLIEGVIAGVGSVLVFLPQILMLFLFLGILEGSGYMARIAFLMDRVMRSIGLHGRAFVPMLSGYACAIPAILATRTMERQRDRMLTMMVVPLMTCSARLPVYVLVIGALFPPTRFFGALPVQGLLMAGMYLFSTLMALAAAAVLGRTLFKGPRVPLILELPPYRRPHWPSVVRMMLEKSGVFVRQAGGVILVCTIALWLLLSFPRQAPQAEGYAARRAAFVGAELGEREREARLEELEAAEAAARLHASYGGRLGRAFEPWIEPLGFDWKIGIGLIGAFAAREVFVSTLGVVYGVGSEADEESLTLREKIRAETRTDGRPVYTPLVGLSLLVFFALACQCMSTLAVVYRETRSWRWPLFLFGYMTVLAWGASFVVYQGGRLLGLG